MKFSVAPMMDWTNRHCRYFMRLLNKDILLYTEMVTANAIIYGDRNKLLSYSDQEHPLAVQLGGSDPKALAQCAEICRDYGYDEINLNVGCPSDRVQRGKIGACLMAEPDLVAECVSAMQRQVELPISIKTRIGIDEQDNYDFLRQFVTKVADAGCKKFIIHARKAWLNGLSPKQNRDVPPLDYERVYQLKRDFPYLTIEINGGITNLAQIKNHLAYVDGVMIGREAYHNPYLLVEIAEAFGHDATADRNTVVEYYKEYCRQQLTDGVSLRNLIRHTMGLFLGLPGAKRWRRYLSEHVSKDAKDISIFDAAMEHMLF